MSLMEEMYPDIAKGADRVIGPSLQKQLVGDRTKLHIVECVNGLRRLFGTGCLELPKA